MENLTQNFPEVSFSVLYVREAHPGAGVPSHASVEAKQHCANTLTNEDGETRLVLIDDLAGTAHHAYGSYPNAVFIINRKGCVVYRSEWNNPSATQAALKELLAGRPATAKSYFRPALPHVALKTLKRGGKGSAADFFKGLPALIWINVVKRNLRLLFNRPQEVLPSADC